MALGNELPKAVVPSDSLFSGEDVNLIKQGILCILNILGCGKKYKGGKTFWFMSENLRSQGSGL
jgi:hypothetical protein